MLASVSIPSMIYKIYLVFTCPWPLIGPYPGFLKEHESWTSFPIYTPKYKPQMMTRLILFFFHPPRICRSAPICLLYSVTHTTQSTLFSLPPVCDWFLSCMKPRILIPAPMGPSSGYSGPVCLDQNQKEKKKVDHVSAFFFFFYEYKLRNNMFPWDYYNIFRSSWRSCLENTAINS